MAQIIPLKKMSLHPLYDSLKNDTKPIDLTQEQKEDLIFNIRKMDEKGCELFFVLLKLFEIDSVPDASDGLPYECRYVAKEYRFDLEKFPDHLKQILYKFVKMHIKNMEEEVLISSERKGLNI